MKTTFLFIVLSSILLGFCNGQDATENQLRLYDSQVDFRHFEYTLNPDNSLKSMSNDTIVNATFSVKIIENQFIKVTLLPSFGGRILSIIYKPTGKELLYQNPVGTPYGIGEGNFYYDFLMVYGGIFPTFPEPEQGKTWGLPWEFQVISNTDEQISIEMSFTDNIEPFEKIPPRFNNASTGITCVVTISVQRDSSAVRYDVKLTNNRNEPVFYEYWTCMTFAPGSAPGDTKTTAGTEIVIPMDQVMLKTWASWFKNSEQPIDLANGIFKWENLRWWKNWKARGIGYAYPSAPSWYGVLNHDNQEGVLRISQDTDIFPGLKIWTWGYEDSIATIPEKAPQNSRRPYIELWSGHGHEFFKNLPSMSPLQVKSTTEYFIPTVGLEQITSANQNAAVFLDHVQTEDSVTFMAQVFATQPNRPVRGSLKLVGSTTIDIGVLEWTTSATSAQRMEGSVLKNLIPVGSYECQFELHSEDAQVLVQATVPYEMQ